MNTDIKSFIQKYAHYTKSGYYPLFAKDNRVYFYRYKPESTSGILRYFEWDYNENETEGFYVLFPDQSMPQKATFVQREIDEFFYLSYKKALDYALCKGESEHIKLVSVFPFIKYDLLFYSDEDDVVVIDSIIVDGDEIYDSSCLSNDIINLFVSNESKNEYLSYVCSQRIIYGFIVMMSKSNETYYFDLLLPHQIPSTEKRKPEIVRKIKCTWKRIDKIASYHRRFGYCAIYWSATHQLLRHYYKHAMLPLPTPELGINEAIARAYDKWEQMLDDNHYLRLTYFNEKLNKWDYELIAKARQKMKRFSL